ncbi:S8 family serine peptidase [Streptomyces stelliscabiei]|uniref:S8 family serine peptidase n=1 Tax=Streptomyces stelliscabiei TaxID=146820 RepID=UPI0029BF088F|nr:S8 family serine peptidase [Streptomyces stelliscabiei]MDX2551721.1 S8 family serine peptidase [Streptomyces stelliscabiei]MDX2614394.1 S8 family serine peptidase [Streptomyces stelliscabiei]MDX2636104.1 S8 family serine peptidase [Streptomyces stelliscabiei]MDX2666523.1 S8 family serine peptidase [Streptomyces stelliscabiei]MDX2713606.1 S8 family serine peptidase [Streptomyces stelliscabiei]
MRRLHTLGAAAGAAGLLAAAITPATAGPGIADAHTRAIGIGSAIGGGTAGPASAPTSRTVTLITGDTVTLTPGPDGRHAVDVRRGAGREAATFLSSERDGEVSVLPADAVPLVRAGRLDPALFNVTRLVKQGYTDARTDSTPVIATYDKGRATPDGARRTLALPGIDGAALSAEKSTAFWADIAPALGTEPTSKAARRLGGGLDRIWLDAQVTVSLETSVPQIGAPEVWRSGHDGKGVKVAVLDTGVDTGHPDLADRIAGSRSFVPDQAVRDGHGHGTHVASTIAGSGAASDGRRKGVAPGAELLVGKVLNDAGKGQSSWIIAGMEWAANSGAKIVSMSLGGTATGPSDVLSETVDELSASTGTLFVIASGNAGPGEQTVGTPGIADSALTVGAVDKSDRLAPFSGRGPRPGDFAVKPEITAPGVGIVAARAAGTTMGTPVDDAYTAANGTSMATPHVAGAAALVAQAHPDWTGRQIKEALASTARTNADDTVFEQGDGRVDAVRAVKQNVFATPTLSFGRFEDGDTGVTTKDITYTNATDTAVELKISSSLPDLTVDERTLTVPARGTATLPVDVDPAQESEGRYTGHVTATAGDVRVTTGVGFEKAPKTYDLAVSLLGRNGKAPTGGSIYTLMELNNAIPDEYGFLGTGWTWEVPAGTYAVSTWIPDRDAGGLAVGTSVVTSPEIKVNGDTEVVLDARKAVEIKPRTEQNSEFQGFTTNVHREGATNGWGLTYSQGFWTKHVYVTPTERVTEGTLEFTAKFRLYEKELTASVTSPQKTSLSSLYYSQTYEDFPLKISGDHRVRAVDAGGGTEADFAGLDVKGKVAVVALGATERAQNALDNATKAGAGYLIAYRKTPGFWIESVDRATTVPLMIATGEEGAALTNLLKTGEKVTLKLSGTPDSPYVYNLLAAQSGAISADQTYDLDHSNTVKRKARYHGATAGEIGADALYTFRPWQLFGVESSHYMRLGTERDEYYYVDPDTRTWHTVYPNWETLRGQWSPLRTFDKAGTVERTENWLRQVIRPGTSEEYGLPQRTGDKLTMSVTELNDSAPGHYGYIDGTDTTGKGRLYADGKLVGDSLLGGYGVFDVPAAEASYRFELDVQRRAAWAEYSTSTHTEWTFASAHTTTETALPLLTVGIVPKGLDLLNRAKSGQELKVDLPVADQLGSVKARSLEAWVSYDDGTSWKEVKVKSGKARFTPAEDAESVSLRVRATDRDGNGIDQTVLRAFGLK